MRTLSVKELMHEFNVVEKKCREKIDAFRKNGGSDTSRNEIGMLLNKLEALKDMHLKLTEQAFRDYARLSIKEVIMMKAAGMWTEVEPSLSRIQNDNGLSATYQEGNCQLVA